MKLLLTVLAFIVAVSASTSGVCDSGRIFIDDFVTGGVFALTQPQVAISNLQAEHPVPTDPATGNNWLFGSETTIGDPSTMLGGNRDIILYIEQNLGASVNQQLRVNINFDASSGENVIRFSSDDGLNPVFELQYDGASDGSDPKFFNKIGLGGLDFSSGGDSLTFFFPDADLSTRFRFEAWSFAADASLSQGVSRDVVINDASLATFDFDDFSPIEGGSLSAQEVFASLGAIRIFILPAGDDTEIDLRLFSIAVDTNACLVKFVSDRTSMDSDTLNEIFFVDEDFLQPSCGSNSLEVGDTVQYGLQLTLTGEGREVFFDIFDGLEDTLDFVPGSLIIESASSDDSVTPQFQVSTDADADTINIATAVDFGSDAVVREVVINVFFQATITTSPIDDITCVGGIGNRATVTGDINLASGAFYGGSDIFSTATTFCLSGTTDLQIAQSARFAGANVAPSEIFELITTFRNVGDITATGLRITVVLPDGLRLTSGGFTPSSNGLLEAPVGDVAVGEDFTEMIASLQVLPDFVGSRVTITCCLTNEGSVPNTCTPQTVCRSVRVPIGVAANVKLAKRGKLVQKLIYSVDYFNVGNAAATDVVVSETVPAGTTFNAEESDSRWVCSAETGMCTISIDSLEANAAECAMFVVDVNPDTVACTEFHNMATIEYPNPPDSDTPDDDVSTWLLVQSQCPIIVPIPDPEPECCACEVDPEPVFCPCPEPDLCEVNNCTKDEPVQSSKPSVVIAINADDASTCDAEP